MSTFKCDFVVKYRVLHPRFYAYILSFAPLGLLVQWPIHKHQHFHDGMYKVPYPFGEFIKTVGEEYQVVKRGRKYHGCAVGKNVMWKKGEGSKMGVVKNIKL